MLLRSGADIDFQGPNGTALHVAVFNGHFKVAKLLLNSGADPNSPGPNGTALQAAKGYPTMEFLLIENGAEVQNTTQYIATKMELERSAIFIQRSWRRNRRRSSGQLTFADGAWLVYQSLSLDKRATNPWSETFEGLESHFRPSIDPQYRGLLPLPPSEPASPASEELSEFPSLPESRPHTPEEEGFKSPREPLQKTSVKSPSDSAVPINFMRKFNGLPITSTNDSFPFARKSRNQPTFWDSSKEYRPLYLPETLRSHGSIIDIEEEVQQREFGELPPLPETRPQPPEEEQQLELNELPSLPESGPQTPED